MVIEPLVFDLLLYLIENRDRIIGRDELFSKLWPGKVVGDSSLNGCVKSVRKALGDSGRRQQIIKTVHGRGYQFIATVDLMEEPLNELSERLSDPLDDATQPVGRDHKPSILVLPFTHQGGDPDDVHFAVGITDEIRYILCRYRDIVVIARDSSSELGSTDPVQAAKHLRADYVLAGNIQTQDKRARVSVRMLSAESGEQVWADRYDREMKDTFKVQDDLAQRIFTRLTGRIEDDSRVKAMQKSEVDMTAYDFLLRGNYYFNDWNASEQDTDTAEGMYARALEIDPSVAAAYVGLGSVWVHRIDRGWVGSSEEAGDKAIKFARRAVELDEFDGNARLVLATAYFFGRSNFDQARAQLGIALELNPNDYQSYCFGGWMCMCSGDLQEGVRCTEEALRRNPLLPDNCLWTIQVTEYLVGQYDKAIDAFGRMLSEEPESMAYIAACHAQLGDLDNAAHSTAEYLEKAVVGQGVKDVRSQEYWAEYFDFRNPAHFEHLLDGLRKAGLVLR